MKKGEFAIYIKWALGIILAIIAIPQIKNLVNFFKDKGNIDGAVSAAPGAVQSNVPSGSGVRALKIKGWAETLKAAFDSWTNKAGTVVAILNDTMNGSEVAALSDYYLRSYGKSLLGQVNDELGSFAAFGGKWDELKDYVKQNLS